MVIPEIEQQKKAKEEKRKSQTRFLKLYIVPIFTIIIFIIIIVALVVPKINEVFARLDEVSANNDMVTQLNTQLSQLKALDANSDLVLSQLDTVNNIATSQNTEVIKFRDKISDLTTQNNLTVVSQKLSESTVIPDASNTGLTGNVNLVEVPFIFEIVGRFEDIKSFIASLNGIDDFVIVKEMDLAVRETDTLSNDIAQPSSEWSLKIDLVKYQFFEAKDLQALYLSVPATASISDQMKSYIILRQQKASTTQTTTTTTDTVTP